MKLTGVQKLARVLRVMVIAVFICNIAALFLVPGLTGLLNDGGVEAVWKAVAAALNLPGYEVGFKSLPMYFAMAFIGVWTDAYCAVLTLFLWACGICTAIILWQAKRVLDTILKGGDLHPLGNAAKPEAGGGMLFYHLRGRADPHCLGAVLLPEHRPVFNLQFPVCPAVPDGGPGVHGHVRPVSSGGGDEGGKRPDHLRGRNNGDRSQSGRHDGETEDVPE